MSYLFLLCKYLPTKMFMFLLLMLFLVHNYVAAKLYFCITESASSLPLDWFFSFIGGVSFLFLLLILLISVVIGLILFLYKVLKVFTGFNNSFYKNERPLLSIVVMLSLLAKGVIKHLDWVLGHIVKGVVVIKDFIMLYKIFFSLLAVAIVVSVSVYFILSGQYQAQLVQWEVFYKAQILIQDINNTVQLESQREQLAAHLEGVAPY